MVAEADFVASVTEVAVRVTVAGVGAVAGAAYFPVASIVPQLAPVQPVPDRLQVTAWFGAAGTHRRSELLHAAGLNRRVDGETVTAIGCEGGGG